MLTIKQLAQLCSDSYLNIKDAINIDNECYIINDVIVFRGTDNIKKWIVDADIRFTPFHGLVHHGFIKTWDRLKKQVINHVGGRSVTLTGHSLGGAVATIAAFDLNVNQIVTFGSPRVGNKEFVKSYNKLFIDTQRCVFETDPVALLPGYLLGFRHVCPRSWFGETKLLQLLFNGILEDHAISNFLKVLP